MRNDNEFYDHPVWMITICDLLFSGLITLMIISIKRTTHNNSQNSEKRIQKSFFTFYVGEDEKKGVQINVCLINWGSSES